MKFNLFTASLIVAMSFGFSSCTKENASTLVELNPGQSITLTHKNTVSVNLPSDRNVSIAIETPTNDFLLLHTPDGIVSLWTGDQPTTLTLDLDKLVGTNAADVTQTNIKSFDRTGKYTLIIAENLETEPENTFWLEYPIIIDP